MPTCRCLSVLARQDGLLEHVLSTEPAEFKLNSFLSKIGRSPIGELNLAVAPESAVDTRLPATGFHLRRIACFLGGTLPGAKENVTFTVHGVRDGAALEMSAKANLPREALDHAAASAALGQGPGGCAAGKDPA